MATWYEGLEPEIRDVVRLLRDNGFNTVCSCGHEMTVDVELGNHLEEAEQLARFLQENGYQKFKLDVELFAGDCLWVRRAHVTLGRWPTQTSEDEKKVLDDPQTWKGIEETY